MSRIMLQTKGDDENWTLVGRHSLNDHSLMEDRQHGPRFRTSSLGDDWRHERTYPTKKTPTNVYGLSFAQKCQQIVGLAPIYK